MNSINISFLFIVLVFTICSFVTETNAGRKKSDILILGGEDGCPPQLFLKTGGKKKDKDILIMNPCQKKKKEYVAYPVYESHEYETHDSGYGQDMGGYGGDSY